MAEHRSWRLIVGGALCFGALQVGGNTHVGAQAYDTVTGVVIRASDGDTMRVFLDGGPSEEVAIRLIGVNAFELGECSADVATDTLDDLVRDQPVSLRIPPDLGPDKYGRIHAYVSVSGDDIGARLLEQGTVWPVPKDWGDPAMDLSYLYLAESAEAAQLGIWSPDNCGSAPDPEASFELRILRNPDGTDSDDPNKEWVKLLNHGSQSVDLSGWGLRSSGEEKYTFPAGTIIASGDYFKVHAGEGNDRPRHRYWGLDRTMYANDHPESVILTDPLGNIRTWKMTPCLENCSDPLRGKVVLRASYDAPGADSTNPNGEWIEIVNVSNETIDLVDYVLINDQHRYIPAGGARVDAGQRLRVYVGSGTSTSTEKYWGKPNGILANSGDTVILRNLDGVRIATLTWPCVGCTTPDLRVAFVNADAPGADETNLNEEYTIVRNDDAATIDLTDWAVRSKSNWYRFEAGRTLAPGAVIRLNSGHGTEHVADGQLQLYWGRDTAAVANTRGTVQAIAPDLAVADCWGWGGTSCDPPERSISMSVYVIANPPGSDTIHANEETIRLKIREQNAVDLSGWRVRHAGRVYTIDDGTELATNQNLTIHAGVGSNTNHHQYWGTEGSILSNSGGVVEVFDADGRLVRRTTF